MGRVTRLAMPAAGELLLNMTVGLVNTYLVGHLGAASLAAVGLASQWMMMTMVLFSAVGTGATALIARMVGARDRDGANRMLWQALVLAFLAGSVPTALLGLLAEPAVAAMGAQGEALAQGVAYLRIVSSVYMLAAVMFIGNSCLRGAGDTRTPLLVMAVVNLLNVAIAWTLINGVGGMPRLGVEGAAIGAMVGRGVGGLLVIGVLLRGRSGLALQWGNWRLDLEPVRRMLRVGLPAGLEQLVMRLGMLVFARVVSSLGTAAFAAHQVVLNSESLSFMPGFGFAVAATTLVGQGLGAQDEQAAERDGHTAFWIAAGFMSVMGIAFALFAPQIVGFFTDDPEVVAMGTLPLRLVGAAQPFLAAMMVFAGALRGAGETLTPLVINGAGVWLLRVPLGLLFGHVLGWGLAGIWAAMTLDMAVRGSLLFARFRQGRWKRVQV